MNQFIFIRRGQCYAVFTRSNRQVIGAVAKADWQAPSSRRRWWVVADRTNGNYYNTRLEAAKAIKP